MKKLLSLLLIILIFSFATPTLATNSCFYCPQGTEVGDQCSIIAGRAGAMTPKVPGCPVGMKPTPSLDDENCACVNDVSAVKCTCPQLFTLDPIANVCKKGKTGETAEPQCGSVTSCKGGSTNCTSAKGLRCNPDSSTFTNEGSGVMTAIGCIPTDPQALINSLLKYGVIAGGGIAFLLMILAAIQMITAEGNPNTIKTAQEKFYSAIIGLLLIIFSILLLQVIGVDILGLKGFSG